MLEGFLHKRSFLRRVGVIHHILDSFVWSVPATPPFLQSCTSTAGILQCVYVFVWLTAYPVFEAYNHFSLFHAFILDVSAQAFSLHCIELKLSAPLHLYF